MTVAQPGAQGIYRFFYVTNRGPAPDSPSLQESFSNQREERLKFGLFETKIEPALGLGMLIDPTEWFQDKEIQLLDVRALDRAAFIKEVRHLGQVSPYRSLLVVVHGYRERFSSALRKTAFVGHILDIDSPVLLFDWPGNQGSTPGGYRLAREVAEASGAELAATLELVIREIRPARLWLLANSMGAQVVADAFSVLYQKPDLADAETEIEDVVLTAPDVGHDEFRREFKQQINALARNLTVYVSSNDRALVMSRILNWEKRLGESTLSPDQLDETVRIAELIDPDSELITLVDVTPVNRTRNFHNFSMETPEFFDDLYLRLTNTKTPRNRLLYPKRTPKGDLYWVLTRGR